MATLCRGGRITAGEVDEEMERLRGIWRAESDGAASADAAVLSKVLGEEGAARLDRFDRVQLAGVSTVVREPRSRSDAGRTLFAVSRRNKERPNDADRLRKYLAKFGIDWRTARQRPACRPAAGRPTPSPAPGKFSAFWA
jgi:transcriptional regulatory protein RtcR